MKEVAPVNFKRDEVYMRLQSTYLYKAELIDMITNV